MEIVKQYEIRGLEGEVTRLNFAGRLVDYWAPNEAPSHLIVTHDGQNIFDRKTATRGRTWKLAQTADRLSRASGVVPPAIIAVFHSGSKENAWGRAHDLAPQEPFQNGLLVAQEKYRTVRLEDLSSNKYLETIVSTIIPTITKQIGFTPKRQHTALLGSSMGGLATLYGIGRHPEIFGAGLAFSPHWVIGEEPLVDAILGALPKPGDHKIWMSRGTRALDGEYQRSQSYADTRMSDLGWQAGRDFLSKVYQGAWHNEPSWRRQAEDALRFWLAD